MHVQHDKFIPILLSGIHMNRKINLEVLKHFKRSALKGYNHHLDSLYSQSYSILTDFLFDIKRPFKSICVHGDYAQHAIPLIKEHNLKQGGPNFKEQITVSNYLQSSAVLGATFHPIISSDLWIYPPDSFDLILTCLELHHTNNEEELFRRYQNALMPDGALIGCSFGVNTLSELYWSYMMAENQRSGGLSPKVSVFQSLGDIGNLLTTVKFRLCNVLVNQEKLQFESVVDLLTCLQLIGESGHLRGRRKAVFKDVLLSMMAIYTSAYQSGDIIKASLCLNKFIGWKYHQTQPKPARRGKIVGSRDFTDELKSFDQNLKEYELDESGDDPKEVK